MSSVMSSAVKLVKIGVSGGKVAEFAFNGESLRTAIEAAGHGSLLGGRYIVRVNGAQKEDLSEQVQNGDVIILAEPIKGNK